MSADQTAVTARFLRYVVKMPSGCWEWVGGRSSWDYGQFYFQGRKVQANRWAYERWVGPLGDLFALHRCDNPPCVNPDHLFAGDNTANLLDAALKGRHPMQVHPESSRIAQIARLAGEKTLCLNGHPLTPDNLFPRRDGRRDCLTCRRERERKRIAATSARRAAARAARALAGPDTAPADQGGDDDGA